MSLSLSPPSSSVTLVIKAPNQKIADQKIECTIDWTVRKLKQHLAKVYPTNPTESQQRIIYSGKLLLDDHQLQDFLKQYEPDQNVHTVHLVCMASMSDSQVPGQSLPEGVLSGEGLRRRHLADTSSSFDPQLNTSSRALPSVVGQSYAPSSMPYVPTVDYQSYMQQQQQQQHPGAMYYGAMPPPVVPSFVPGFSPYGVEQLQWMQQAYAQSMMHYMQQFQQQQQATTVHPHLVGHAPPVTPVIPVPLANQNFPNELQGGAIVDPEPPLQQMRLNAQGGREADDEDGGERGNRDWLDSTYVFVRFLMLMSILYFYSTPQRFLSMLMLAFFAYVGRAGWLRRGRRANRNAEQQREQQREQQQREAGAGAAPAPPPQQEARQEMPQPTEDAEQETNMVDLQATHRPSTFEVIWSVITSFFASLIPENPPPININ